MKHVVASLRWCGGKTGPWRTVPPTARLTAYRRALGPSDLFSVFVRFSDGGRARIYAAVESMLERLPELGGTLVLTDGREEIADCEVVEVSDDMR